MHVNTVDTVEKPWFWAFQNFKHIENWLNIKEGIDQKWKLVEYQGRYRPKCNPRVFSVYVNTVNKQHSIHNTQSIALILCINHLDMSFNVHTTDKVTMITVSGFLTV